MRSGAKVADIPGWSSCLIPDHDELAVDPSAAPVLLIDGHYIVYRSFHGMPHLSTPDGTPVGALLGFCNVINKLVRFTVEESLHYAVHHVRCGPISLSGLLALSARFAVFFVDTSGFPVALLVARPYEVACSRR